MTPLFQELGGAGVNNGTSLNLVTLPPNQENDTTNGLKTAAAFGGLNGGGAPAVIEGNNGTNNGENGGGAALAASPVAAVAAGAEKIAVLGPLVDYDSDSEEESSGSDDR